MRVFISWSKDKSRQLALATKKLISSTLGNKIEVFFSPDMYKGTCVDHEIHVNLLQSDKCIVCITSDNFKNPWLMYEAGVVYGGHHATPGVGSVVIPILFEHIPEWSSWVDKPLNRYVPMRLDNVEINTNMVKEDFKHFLQELAVEAQAEVKNFGKHWKAYIDEVQNILQREQLIPITCRDLVDQILKDNDGNFIITSPEITKEHVLFHKGFSTNILIRILVRNVIDYQGKRLWFYGRRNKKLLTSENDDFFRFLATEGLANGVDFRCLFPHPKSPAMDKAVSKDKQRRFLADLQNGLEAAVRFERRFHLPVEKMFRLYKAPRKESIVVSDSAVLYSPIICDSEGYPLPITNSSFEILGIDENDTNSRAKLLCDVFIGAWEAAIPLTEDLYKQLYDTSIV